MSFDIFPYSTPIYTLVIACRSVKKDANNPEKNLQSIYDFI